MTTVTARSRQADPPAIRPARSLRPLHRPAGAARTRRKAAQTPAMALLPALLLGLALTLLSACTVKPTPYQPLQENGGYEETRLQAQVYRVSFRGNSATPETTVLDSVFRRCAELTLAQSYTHFLIQENFGRTGLTLRPTGVRMGVGMGFSSRSSFWGLGVGGPLSDPQYAASVDYHLAIFMIRLLSAEEAARIPEAERPRLFDAADLLKGLPAAAAPSPQPPGASPAANR